MIKNRTIATVAALGGLTAAIALLAGLPAAKADELADLRANQELLQQRLDQLAQAPPPPGAALGVGSFPRSFLIPGTDTSLRVGGFGIGRVTWYLRGVQPSADLFGQGNANGDRTEGSGGTGRACCTAQRRARKRIASARNSGSQYMLSVPKRTPRRPSAARSAGSRVAS